MARKREERSPDAARRRGMRRTHPWGMRRTHPWWFHFGPGLAIAALLAGFILSTRWEDNRRQEPPRILRTVASSVGQSGAGPALEVSVLLAQRERLHLTADQVSGLKRLQGEWERVSAPGRGDAERAAREFQAWMEREQKRGRVALGEVRQHGAELSALSARLSEQRRTYWQSALQLLSEEQRNAVKSLPLSPRQRFPS